MYSKRLTHLNHLRLAAPKIISSSHFALISRIHFTFSATGSCQDKKKKRCHVVHVSGRNSLDETGYKVSKRWLVTDQ
jgi:hypothetical protein